MIDIISIYLIKIGMPISIITMFSIIFVTIYSIKTKNMRYETLKILAIIQIFAAFLVAFGYLGINKGLVFFIWCCCGIVTIRLFNSIQIGKELKEKIKENQKNISD